MGLDFEVHETFMEREPISHDPFIDEFKREQPAVTFDYTAQLEFHEYELSQAEVRGFPEGQIEYHVGRIALLKGLGYGQV